MASATSTGSPTTAASTPGGGLSSSFIVVDHLALLVQRLEADAEGQVRGLAVARDGPLLEVGGHGVEQAGGPAALLGVAGLEQVGQREGRAQVGRVASS